MCKDLYFIRTKSTWAPRGEEHVLFRKSFSCSVNSLSSLGVILQGGINIGCVSGNKSIEN